MRLKENLAPQDPAQSTPCGPTSCVYQGAGSAPPDRSQALPIVTIRPIAVNVTLAPPARPREH